MIDFVNLPPAERCAAILCGLHRMLVFKGHGSILGQALLRLLSARVRGAAARIAALGARLAAGTLHPRPPRERPLPPRRPAPPQTEPSAPPGLRLPGGFGWLLRLAPGIVACRSQLGFLIQQPDMAALIAAAPPVAHHLRPICRMLGLKPPPGLFPSRRRRRRPPPETRPAQSPVPAPGAAEKAPPAAPPPPAAPGIPLFVRPSQRLRRRRRRPVSLFPLEPA